MKTYAKNYCQAAAGMIAMLLATGCHSPVGLAVHVVGKVVDDVVDAHEAALSCDLDIGACDGAVEPAATPSRQAGRRASASRRGCGPCQGSA